MATLLQGCVDGLRAETNRDYPIQELAYGVS